MIQNDIKWYVAFVVLTNQYVLKMEYNTISNSLSPFLFPLVNLTHLILVYSMEKYKEQCV